MKADRVEIEVATDGAVIDVVTIITMAEFPEAAAKAIQDALEGGDISKLSSLKINH